MIEPRELGAQLVEQRLFGGLMLRHGTSNDRWMIL
jgi:hypothetical protein